MVNYTEVFRLLQEMEQSVNRMRELRKTLNN